MAKLYMLPLLFALVLFTHATARNAPTTARDDAPAPVQNTETVVDIAPAAGGAAVGDQKNFMYGGVGGWGGVGGYMGVLPVFGGLGGMGGGLGGGAGIGKVGGIGVAGGVGGVGGIIP